MYSSSSIQGPRQAGRRRGRIKQRLNLKLKLQLQLQLDPTLTLARPGSVGSRLKDKVFCLAQRVCSKR